MSIADHSHALSEPQIAISGRIVIVAQPEVISLITPRGGCSVWAVNRPLPPPCITEYNQITHDGRSKGLGGTDGTRLYFSHISPTSIAQVGVNGGEITPLPITVPGADSYMVDLSPDGSNALVRVYPANRSLWVVPILGGSARQVGSREGSYDGAFSPEWGLRGLFHRPGEVFVVRNDGTGSRKLADVGPVSLGCLPRFVQVVAQRESHPV